MAETSHIVISFYYCYYYCLEFTTINHEIIFLTSTDKERPTGIQATSSKSLFYMETEEPSILPFITRATEANCK